MNTTMRGLFSIVRGRYKKGKGRAITNRVSGDTNYLGGYDPEDTENPEWYMLYETEHYTCVSCGSDLDTLVRMVYTYIVRYKTRNKILHALTNGQQRYPIDEAMMEEVINMYGHYYDDLVEEQEDLAFEELKSDTVFNRAKKRLHKRTHTSVEVIEKKVEVINTKNVETKKKKGLVPKKRKISVVFS